MTGGISPCSASRGPYLASAPYKKTTVREWVETGGRVETSWGRRHGTTIITSGGLGIECCPGGRGEGPAQPAEMLDLATLFAATGLQEELAEGQKKHPVITDAEARAEGGERRWKRRREEEEEE
eukprot:5355075-Pyramimonas_sp.AAC.1